MGRTAAVDCGSAIIIFFRRVINFLDISVAECVILLRKIKFFLIIMCFRCNYCGFHLRFENKANAKCYQAGNEHDDDYSKNFASAFIGRNVKRFAVCGHFKEFVAGIEIIIESPYQSSLAKSSRNLSAITSFP